MTPDDYTEEELQAKTVPELIEIADSLELEGISKLKKAGLIAKIMEAEAGGGSGEGDVADDEDSHVKESSVKEEITIYSRYEITVSVNVGKGDEKREIKIPFDNCVAVFSSFYCKAVGTTKDELLNAFKNSERYGKEYVQVAGEGVDKNHPAFKSIMDGAKRIRKRKNVTHGARSSR